MDTVKLKINELRLMPPTPRLLEAARQAGIEIPTTLLFKRNEQAAGSCRMCVVEVKGARGPVAACVYPVNEGMEVFTNTPLIQKSRKMTLELILSNHRKECLTCVRNQNCELQKLARDFGLEHVRFGGDLEPQIEASTPRI